MRRPSTSALTELSSTYPENAILRMDMGERRDGPSKTTTSARDVPSR